MKSIYVFESVINEKAKVYANEVLNSGWVGMGKKTKEFEEKFAKYIGRKYAVATNSCTSALHLAAICGGLKKGSVVATTSMTFVSTNAVILYCNSIPYFIDVCPETVNLNIDELLINPYFKSFDAAMIVHYGGYPIDFGNIQKIKEKKKSIFVIEDCAHALGARYSDTGTMVGTAGDISVFSFHAVKNLASPDGGMLVTDNEEIYKRAMKLRWMGINKDTSSRFSEGNYSWEYGVDCLGYKYHMNDLTAAICLGNLETLEYDNSYRRHIIEQYSKRLINVKMVAFYNGACHSGHLAAGFVQGDRNKLLKELNQQRIYPGVHYIPNHKYEIFSKYVVDPLPVTEKVYENLITLPCHLKMEQSDVDIVIDAVNDIL